MTAPDLPLIAETAPTHRHRHRTRHGRRRRAFLIGASLVVLIIAAAGVALAVTRYLPALDDARALRTDLTAFVDRAKAAGLGIERPDLVAMRADLASARDRADHIGSLLRGDPLVALARALPPTHEAIAGADTVTAAGNDVLDAGDALVSLADRFVSIKERQSAAATGAGAKAGGSALADLVELMATGGADVDRALAPIDRAQTLLDATPADLPGPIAQVRDVMRTRLADYAPALRAYAGVDGTLPAILGWDGPKRYLVLTQDPAELRPTGGFIGSFGAVTFDRGRLTEHAFQDVSLLDLPWKYPFITPPPALGRYLLGPKQPWQLADANWSPDFPTSAQEAMTLYRNEGGTGAIDGVIGITTQTIDELLAVTGPVAVPDTGVTIASGETTLKVLQNTRISSDPSVNRKAFLSVFASRLFDTLLALPPARWTELAGRADAFGSGRLVLAWLADPAAESAIVKLGFDGAVRQDPGDYVYPVDSNVSPASKLNAVTDRALELNVHLDAVGDATNELAVTWTNRIMTPEAQPYRELKTLEGLTTMGMYFRLVVPERSRVQAVTAGTTMVLHDPADVTDELGRTVIANYFRIPPGEAHLRYTWISPYPAATGDDGIVTYQLTIQKQPGLRPGPLMLRITLPPGADFIDASPGLTRAGNTFTVETTFDRDLVAVVRYRLAPESPA